MILQKNPVRLMGMASMNTDEMHLPVDEQALAADLEMLVERELGVRMKFQVHTPHNDPRPQEPVADLSGLIDMEIEIDAE